MATTAVSFRKGNTEENNAFAGVTGEIVADLGVNTQDTSNATIVLHTGNGVAGGIRMAREDMNNITTESINNLANFQEQTSGGTYYGLARRNLSNYVSNNVNASLVEGKLKADYKIASQNATDINTTELTGPDGPLGDNDAPGGGLKLATRTLSNLASEGEVRLKQMSFGYWLDAVNTSHLAESSGTEFPNNSGTMHNKQGKNLAYADMSNVDTANLATAGAGHSGDNLAYANLNNVGYQTLVDHFDDAYDANIISTKYEHIGNKSNLINKFADNLSIQYPTLNAVIDYTASVSQNYTNRYLDNVISWEIASRKEKNLYKIIATIDDGGANYSENELITITSVTHPDSGQQLQLKVLTIDQNGAVLEVAIQDFVSDLNNGTSTKYSTAPIADTSFVDTKGGTFTISTEEIVSGKLMRADLTNSDINNYTNTQHAVLHYEISEDAVHNITNITSVSGELTDKNTNTFGSFSSDVENNGIVSRLSSIITSSSATISQTQGTSLTDLSVNLTTFETQTTTTDNYVFVFDGTDWKLDGNIVVLGDYGISFTGTPITDDEITVVYENQKPNKISSIAVTKDNAYLNKNETPVGTLNNHEIFDTNHELLNRGEINSAIQDAMDAAIATAVVFKGIVADETALPSSGQTNGDLYWVTAFSSNPPAGMISGKSGSAIWNANITPEQWEYKLDNQNAPDNQTLEYSGGSTQQVLKVKIAGTQTEGPNALVVKSDGLYVKTPVETPAIPTADGVYHLYVNNGVVSWVNDTRLQVTNQ